MAGSNVPDKIAVFDLETSGVDVASDRVVTAFVGLLSRDGEMLEKKSWLVNPGVEIPQGAIDVHGITNEKAQAEGIPARDGVFGIMQALDIYDRKGIAIAGFNLAFDFSMLYYEAKRYGYRPFEPRAVIDGFIIDKALDKYRKGKRTLGVTAAHYGVEVPEDLHDAEVDCRVAGQLAFKLLEKIDKPVAHIHERCIQHAKDQAAGYQEYLRSNKNPKGADLTAVIDGQWPIKYGMVENSEGNKVGN